MNIFLVMPSYNEGNRLTKTIKAALPYIKPSHMVVVDDASIKTEEVPKGLGIWLLRHKVNLGKGAAMRTGADFAFDQGAEAVIFMDADCQHNPDELATFIKYLQQGYDVVFGSRKQAIDTPLVRLLGRKLSSVYSNLLFGIYVSDTLSGYRGLSKNLYPKIRWQANRYAVESEMIARMGRFRNEIKTIEFPVDTIYIDKYKGMTIFDAIRLFFASLVWKFN